ncbi:unnamed protein product [Paramecium octaurelia]|uniref:Uncharacterized protein n=1 Tax=Paramecium octaurelia TaxID=43137 RepID=A0A8S1US44_PAROT|nr:unnamed protein product [Paramecium octaurelia]
MDLVKQAFQKLYFPDQCYENMKVQIDQFSYNEINSLMEFYVQNYLDSIKRSALVTLLELERQYQKSLLIVRDQNTKDKHFRMDYFKSIRQTWHQWKYAEYTNLMNQLNLTLSSNIVILQTKNYNSLRTKGLLANLLLTRIRKGGNQGFEKKIIMSNDKSPDNQKLQMNLLPNQEKNMMNLKKKL